MEQLQHFLAQVPVLADLLAEAVRGVAGQAPVNSDEQRVVLERLHGQVIQDLRARRALYATRFNDRAERTCAACQATYAGDYLEFNNAHTGRAVVCEAMLVHAFVAHGQLVVTESQYNTSGIRVAEVTRGLNLPELARVLADSACPPELVAAAQAAAATQEQLLAPTRVILAHQLA
ncbi:MAG: hypothetical protein VKQ33_13840 [Candidatus Sericytochromatia bacterium]|nr:hypothetical protein [Candidatus Sericytochromatia bacterium]